MSSAFFMPGKTIEQIQTEREAEKQRDATPVSLELTFAEVKNYAEASRDAEYLLASAGDIFELLHSGFVQGFLEQESPGVISLLEIVGRGFAAAAEKEGVALTRLNGKLREIVEEGEMA